MAKQVLMPQLGESVTEGLLTKWLKAKGEPVEEFEALLEINTDKVDTEIPSPAKGVLIDILVPAGTTVKVGETLAWIGERDEIVRLPPHDQGEEIARSPVKKTAPNLEVIQSEAVIATARTGFISPVVRRIAQEHALDLSQIAGSGLHGRITKTDVLAYLEAQTARGVNQPSALSQTSQPAGVSGVPGSPGAYPAFSLPGDEILTLSPVRRSIAEHMVFSERTSPHVTTVMEADLSRVIAHRQANRETFARDGASLTFTAYFASAAVAALKTYPLVNASWSDQGIVVHHIVNLGLAASLGEAGLIVPVIKQAEGLSLLGLARAINDLAQRARARQLKPDEVKGGTFTITNHGITGSLFAAPIINQPQCAILGVGAIQKRVVVTTDALGNDSLAIRPMVYLSLTFDHRILDGALADLFLNEVVKSLGIW